MQSSKKLVLLCISILASFTLVLCIVGSLYTAFFPTSEDTAPDDSPAVLYDKWQLLYPDTEWGKAAAELLADRLCTTSAPLIVRPLAEAEANRAAIVLAPQADPGASLQMRAEIIDQVGETGYIITQNKSEGKITLSAISPQGLQDAIDAFCAELDKLSVTVLAETDLREQICVTKEDDQNNASALISSDIPLAFDDDGRFKILLASNLSAGQGESPSPYTITALQKTIEAESPDLVLLCGNIANGFSTREALQAYLQELLNPLEEAGIPWAHLHAGDDLLDRSVKDSVYAEFAHCVSKPGDYFLPIYANESLVFGVWMMNIPEAATLTYTPEQLADLTASSECLSLVTNHSIPSLMALAYPLPEFVDAASNRTAGEVGEAITIPATNSGLFQLASSLGVRAIYAGGNPLNSYTGTYNGIELGSLASLGYDSYGFGGTFETNNRLRGSRIVELDLSDLSVITSRMVYAADLGIDR